jgi:phosphoribosylanthranilate isomerase
MNYNTFLFIPHPTMTRIKICGITREQDVHAAANNGADALGFVFYKKSPRHVTIEQAIKLIRAVPPFVSVVGLFVNPTVDEVREVLRYVPLEVLQFHGEEELSLCTQFNRPYLKAIRVTSKTNLLQCAARYADAQGLLLDAFVDGTHGGTGASFDWSLITKPLPLPLILSGGLHPGNVAAAIRLVRPDAVDVSTGVEAAKGIKDAAKVAAFIKEVKSVDLQLS